jgi:hypothetical protein
LTRDPPNRKQECCVLWRFIFYIVEDFKVGHHRPLESSGFAAHAFTCYPVLRIRDNYTSHWRGAV